MKKAYYRKNMKRILRQDISIPVSVRNGMNMALLQINDLQTMKGEEKVTRYNYNRLIKKVAVAFLLVTLGAGVTTVAAEIIKWNTKVANKFEANPKQQEELIESGAAKLLDTSDTQNGITISAVQSIADKKYMYLLFKIVAPENIPLTESTFFDKIKITVGGKKIKATHFGGWLDNEMPDSEEDTANIKYWEVWINNKGEKTLMGENITVTFSDMISLKNDKVGATPSINGEWNITCNTGNADVTKNVAIGKQIKEFNTTVKEIGLSPISLTVLYEYERTELTEQVTNKDGSISKVHEYQIPAAPISFQMVDGSIIDIPKGGPGTEGYSHPADLANNECFISFAFSKIIDIEKVSAIIFKEKDKDLTVTIPIR